MRTLALNKAYIDKTKNDFGTLSTWLTAENNAYVTPSPTIPGTNNPIHPNTISNSN